VRFPDSLRPLLKRLANCALAVAGFTLMCAILHAALPPVWIPEVSTRLEHLRKEGDRYDAVFVGSSRLLCQISPRLFDQLVGEQGVTCRSFNAGVYGMLPPETGYFSGEVLDAKPDRLRWLFVELYPLPPDLASYYDNTERGMYWHTPGNTAAVLHANWVRFRQLLEDRSRRGMEKVRKIGDTATNFGKQLWLFVRNYTNFGRGAKLFAAWINDEKKERRPLGPHGDGWLPRDIRANAAERAKIERAVAEAHEKKGEERAKKLKRGTLRSALIEKAGRHFTALDARARAAGAQLVLVVPPHLGDTTPDKLIQYVREENIPVLAFNDPLKYPALYLADNRTDAIHLNRLGALEFTRMLASEFAALPSTKR